MESSETLQVFKDVASFSTEKSSLQQRRFDQRPITICLQTRKSQTNCLICITSLPPPAPLVGSKAAGAPSTHPPPHQHVKCLQSMAAGIWPHNKDRCSLLSAQRKRGRARGTGPHCHQRMFFKRGGKAKVLFGGYESIDVPTDFPFTKQLLLLFFFLKTVNKGNWLVLAASPPPELFTIETITHCTHVMSLISDNKGKCCSPSLSFTLLLK